MIFSLIQQLGFELFLHQRVQDLEEGVGYSLSSLGIPLLYQQAELVSIEQLSYLFKVGLMMIHSPGRESKRVQHNSIFMSVFSHSVWLL